ncbi:MAG: biopolymer transporter ExbD [Kofleriaceae bacterium]
MNVELNIVPFIDLMSCLTAFLLVTAVWVNISQLSIEPVGKTREAGPPCLDNPECDKPKLSVLVEQDNIWIGVSRVNDFESVPKLADGSYDWSKVEDRLKAQKRSAFFVDDTHIEIAANSTKSSPVAYQHLIAAMDVAVKAGFIDVGLSDVDGLSARPTL